MTTRQADRHRARIALAVVALAALLAGVVKEAPNCVGWTRHANTEASFLRLAAAREGRYLPAEAANYRALAMMHRRLKARYAPSAVGVICLAGALVTASLALASWVRVRDRRVGLRAPRVTIRQLMGVVMITALLLPGFLFVCQADADVRWPLALMVAFLYIIASPALLVTTAWFFWPDSSVK
jgi:hypothetical protein